jgi:general secretion pathway protein D
MGMGGGQFVSGQGLVPSSITFISFDPTDNSLIIVGEDEEDINTLITYINSLDTFPKQVSVKVEFITTQETLDKSLGYNINYARGAVILGMTPSEFVRVSDPVFLTYSTGNAVFRLRTRLAEGNSKLVTAPIVRTLNNTPGSVFAMTQSFIFATFQNVLPGGTLQSQVQPIPIQAPTSLFVTPRINNDGTIVMALSPFLTSIIGFQQGPGGQELPIQTTQSVSVIARVKDGETIVLGGLNIENSQYNTNRVPVLSELPLIGQFFRRVTQSKSNSELLIFVTPKIIDEDSGALNP